MNSTTYADGVENISVINGLARLELVIANIAKDGDKQVQVVPSGTLVISLDGFVKLHAQIDGMVKKMLEDGILKQADQASTPEVKLKN